MELTSASNIYDTYKEKWGEEDFNLRLKYADKVSDIIASVCENKEIPSEDDEIDYNEIKDSTWATVSFFGSRIKQTMITISKETFEKWREKFDAGDAQFKMTQASRLMKLVEKLITEGKMI